MNIPRSLTLTFKREGYEHMSHVIARDGEPVEDVLVRLYVAHDRRSAQVLARDLCTDEICVRQVQSDMHLDALKTLITSWICNELIALVERPIVLCDGQITVTRCWMGSATLEAAPRDYTGEDDAVYDATMDGVESLVLAHASAGVPIASAAYQEGLAVALEAVAQNC